MKIEVNQKESDGKVIKCCSECGLFVQLKLGTCYSADIEDPKGIDKRIVGKGFPVWCPLPDVTKTE